MEKACRKYAETETLHFASITKESIYLSKLPALVGLYSGMFAANNIAEYLPQSLEKLKCFDMHILKFLLAPAVCLSLLVSCTKNDQTKPLGSIEGTWKVTVISYAGTSTTHVAGQTVKADFKGKGKDMDLTLTFSKNPDVYVAKGSYRIEMHTMVEGEDYPTDFADSTFLGGGTWSGDGEGKYVTVTNEDGRSAKARLYRIDDNTITMSFDQSSTETEQGIPVQLDMHGVYVLQQ